ncbi:52 kDa repressor of the inhibitor of the protein kinase-like 8 [Homarus americanus]|uniref:52 kDa repressor of the inhibitor of the protein kinase-like 14 n=1 Tax=Homarus americanus TaxID=6706 RepID=A0A8J5NCE8_HOMAM|nr:52 kDa repressor of the inhibitor of the protein kinase-like 14 [Homarus americanus]KAG7177430.1 52 kDa repressor of the inhibitor of the protein kinase-like 8 [Homarus americanus]
MRFTPLHQKVFQGLSVIPSISVTLTPAEGSRRIQELVDLYREYLLSPGSIKSEVHTWRIRWGKKAKE